MKEPSSINIQTGANWGVKLVFTHIQDNMVLVTSIPLNTLLDQFEKPRGHNVCKSVVFYKDHITECMVQDVLDLCQALGNHTWDLKVVPHLAQVFDIQIPKHYFGE